MSEIKINPPIAEVLVLMFHINLRIKDNTDLMRCHILGMKIETLVKDHEPTKEEIKETAEYKGCHYDVPFSDDFLQELIDRAILLHKKY